MIAGSFEIQFNRVLKFLDLPKDVGTWIWVAWGGHVQKLAHGGTVPGVDAIVVVKMGTCHGSDRLQHKGIFVNIWPKNTVFVYFFRHHFDSSFHVDKALKGGYVRRSE